MCLNDHRNFIAPHEVDFPDFNTQLQFPIDFFGYSEATRSSPEKVDDPIYDNASWWANQNANELANPNAASTYQTPSKRRQDVENLVFETFIGQAERKLASVCFPALRLKPSVDPKETCASNVRNCVMRKKVNCRCC